jgi:hypothetical protein
MVITFEASRLSKKTTALFAECCWDESLLQDEMKKTMKSKKMTLFINQVFGS